MRRLILFSILLMALPAQATTKLYLKQPLSSFASAYGYANPTQSVLSPTTSVTRSATSGTNIQWTKTSGGTVVKWLSPPLSAGVTISGTFTANFWGFESSTSCNCGERVVVVVDSGGTGSCAGSTIIDTSRGVELGTGSAALQNWTATPTSTTLNAGDRICITPRITNVGTMGNAFTVTNSYGGKTAAAAGDTYIQFNENLTFQSEAEFIQGITNLIGVAAGTITCVMPGNTASGNLLYAQAFSTTGVTMSPSDGTNIYTSIDGPTTWNTSSKGQNWYAQNVSAGSPYTVTITFGSNDTGGCFVAEYAGLDTSSPLDIHTVGTGNSATLDSGSAGTTNFSNEIFVGAGAIASAAAVAAGTGYVLHLAAAVDLGIEDQSNTSTGTADATMTSTSQQWIMNIATFKWGTQPAPPPSCTPNGALLHVGSCG